MLFSYPLVKAIFIANFIGGNRVNRPSCVQGQHCGKRPLGAKNVQCIFFPQCKALPSRSTRLL